MKIAIDVADLDCKRIDGTRVYIQNVLKYLGELAPDDEFFLFHKGEYNKLLRPAEFENYKDRSLGKGFWWTQWKFARAVRKLRPEVCWMPIQQLPFLVKSLKSSHFAKATRDKKVESRGTRCVVTIHDLAFKFFPEHFPWLDRLKLNLYTDMAVKRADKIIAISEATKRDLVRLYPEIDAEKIEVVYHGFDKGNFQQEFSLKEKKEFLERWKLVNKNYLLYVGAIQPRKDLVTLIRAFEAVKQQDTRYKVQPSIRGSRETNKSQDTRYKIFVQGGPAEGWQDGNQDNNEVRPFPSARSSLASSSRPNLSNLKLVLAGEVAWKSESTVRAVENSEFRDDIILTGQIDFKELAMFYRLAKIFVFPSLYEGFGIPLLEAMTSGTPVVIADNSSLSEVGGEAVLKFESGNVDELTEQIKKLLESEESQQEMIEEGYKRIEDFSWEKCARETMKVMKD